MSYNPYMSSCCAPKPEETDGSCHSHSKRDYWLLGSMSIVAIGYFSHLFGLDLGSSVTASKLEAFGHHSFELMNKMWWGIFLGAVAVGVLQYVPPSTVQNIMKSNSRWKGLFRATLAGVLLDLCSHGILMVGVKLYKKGMSLGQTMAFLIASPWNSFSLTIILISLIGLKWTLAFTLFSAVVALISGWIFDVLVEKSILPSNPASMPAENSSNCGTKSKFWDQLPKSPKGIFNDIFWFGMKDSMSIIKWLFIGIIMASAMREIFTPDQFQSFFGPDFKGLMITLLLATVVEVCSEGSAPIAGDILVSAKAPGNAFGFLMTGVSTDYTEIMAIRENMKSWKIALFLPLITVPQVMFLAWIMNQF